MSLSISLSEMLKETVNQNHMEKLESAENLFIFTYFDRIIQHVYYFVFYLSVFKEFRHFGRNGIKKSFEESLFPYKPKLS